MHGGMTAVRRVRREVEAESSLFHWFSFLSGYSSGDDEPATGARVIREGKQVSDSKGSLTFADDSCSRWGLLATKRNLGARAELQPRRVIAQSPERYIFRSFLRKGGTTPMATAQMKIIEVGSGTGVMPKLER